MPHTRSCSGHRICSRKQKKVLVLRKPVSKWKETDDVPAGIIGENKAQDGVGNAGVRWVAVLDVESEKASPIITSLSSVLDKSGEEAWG